MKLLRKIGFLLPASLLCLVPATSPAQIAIGISISVHTAPPMLPVYVQPACPVAGYLWTPGYWAWSPAFGYYWVPGVWIAPPHPGLLWTPGYWGFVGGVYGWHPGYWGLHVGFYGGVNYGGGYGGVGFIGGGWSGGVFRYNTAVVNVNTTVVRNVYVDRTVINNTTVINNHASFNGPGGVTRQPTPAEQAAVHEQHFQPTAAQTQHETTAKNDPGARFSANNGHPANAAMARPGARPMGNAMNNNRQAGGGLGANNHPQGNSYAGGGHPANSGNVHQNQAGGHPQNQPGAHAGGNAHPANHPAPNPKENKPQR
jgi:hypothetical protein